MARDFPTPRHLDEPLRVWGLTIAQWVGVCVAAVCTYGAWLVVGPAGPWVVPLPPVWAMGLRIFCAGLVGVAVFMTVYLLTGTPPAEPLGRQYGGYLCRRHRYRPTAAAPKKSKGREPNDKQT